ncbi:hypothetical protein MAR_013138, partial [Mya arenaria]
MKTIFGFKLMNLFLILNVCLEQFTYLPRIESDIVDFRSEGFLVCMIGDFNARSGLLSDFISVDQHISDDIETEILLNKNNLDVLGFPSERYSEDYTYNNYGHRFIDLCKSLDVHIANGRLFKDAFIDVHNPVYITVGAAPLPVVEKISNDISDDANNVKPTWNPNSLNDFINCIDQESVEQLSLFIDRTQVDSPCTSDLIDDITMKTGKILTDAADKCKLFKVKKKQNIFKSKTKPWFDNECKAKQKEFYGSKQKYRRFHSHNNFVSLKNHSKAYKKVLNSKFKDYHDCIAQKFKNLRYSKPKEYWCLLHKFSGERKEVLNK